MHTADSVLCTLSGHFGQALWQDYDRLKGQRQPTHQQINASNIWMSTTNRDIERVFVYLKGGLNKNLKRICSTCLLQFFQYHKVMSDLDNLVSNLNFHMRF